MTTDAGQKNLKFSVIMVVRNKAVGALATIESVIGQKHADYEFIVVDGASSDETKSVLSSYKSSIDILISEPDNGIYDAMMKGVRAASGEWIIFMNAGDRFYHDQILSAVGEHKTGLIYGDGRIANGAHEIGWPTLPIAQFWKKMAFPHQALFVRREVQLKYGFDPSFKIVADYDFISRAISGSEGIERTGLIITKLEPAGFSGESFWARTAERWRASRRSFPEKPVSPYFIRLVLEHAYKRFRAKWNRL